MIQYPSAEVSGGVVSSGVSSKDLPSETADCYIAVRLMIQIADDPSAKFTNGFSSAHIDTSFSYYVLSAFAYKESTPFFIYTRA